MNADHSHPIIPGCDDLVVDPLALGCVGAYQDDRAGASFQLTRNPLLDGVGPALRNGFPVVVSNGLVANDHYHVSHLACSPGPLHLFCRKRKPGFGL